MKLLLILTSFLIITKTVFPQEVEFKNPLNSEKNDSLSNLDLLLKILPPERKYSQKLSFLDNTFHDWLKRTGEIPPDFDKMPSIPFIPDPLVLDEGGENIPVKTMEQWKEKREWIKDRLSYYIDGTSPPPPENINYKIIDEKKDGKVRLQLIELSFGPAYEAKLTIEMMIPPGKGPFPVFLTQWNHREWAQIAVRRGYIGCIYAGSDSKDDTEKYDEIWAGKYDFNRLRRRAYGASRAVDYLYNLPYVDKQKIGITGHSRNGKQSMIAAAYDERITACIPSSAGTGGEIPFRYSSEKYDCTGLTGMALFSPQSWLHPRARFFIGRENKLPVDQNLYLALIAPRGLMLSTAINESAGNPWGTEHVYLETLKVYDFLGAENKIAIRLRYGLHSICARDMEDYIDFFDYVFGRSEHRPENRLLYNYSFEKWKRLSNETIDIQSFPEKKTEDIIVFNNKKIKFSDTWEKKKSEIIKNIKWILGDEPPGVINPGPRSPKYAGRGENSFGSFLERPSETTEIGLMAITPYKGFGDQLFGYLYYPKNKDGSPKSHSLPVIIYLHEYDFSQGFSSDYHDIKSMIQSFGQRGYAIFFFDMIGFGNRIEEGTRFYERYPHWSKMGKMVADTRGAVEALRNLEFIDKNRVFVAGYSLGALVGLYSASLDERVAGIVSVSGFTPMRTNFSSRGTQGIMEYSHLHGLLPRLGFFVGNESRIPFDFHELLGCIAPRPVLIIAPQLDKDAHFGDIKACYSEVKKIYSLYEAPENIQLYSPYGFNRLTPEILDAIYKWFDQN